MASGFVDGRRTAGIGGKGVVSAVVEFSKISSDLSEETNHWRRIGGRRCKMKSASILLALLCATALAQDPSDSVTRSKIVALEGAWNQAYKSADAKALDALLDNAIVLVNDDGSVQTKSEFLASVKPAGPQAGAQEQQVLPESISVHVFGNAAIATGIFRAKGVEGGKPYVRRERFVDTWISKDGRWICIATNATPILH
jgi:ketosteroid isomerase-like protein